MPDGTTFTCPICALTWRSSNTFSGLTMSNNGGGNFVVVCPNGHPFDAAPDDGTYSTIDGRLMRVADQIVTLRQGRPDVDAQLARLREEVERLGRDASQRDVEATIKKVAPAAAPLILRVLRDPAFANATGAAGWVLALLALVLGR